MGRNLLTERLLEDKAHIQNQLRDLSGESNDDERNLPRTLGEHQMQFLTHLQSIRDAQVYKDRVKTNPVPTLPRIEGSETPQRSEARTLSGGSSQSSLSDFDVNKPVRFQHVARLKEMMETNLRVLRDQIDWNQSKINEEERMKKSRYFYDSSKKNRTVEQIQTFPCRRTSPNRKNTQGVVTVGRLASGTAAVSI